ncbi:DEAD/DEAH box helicase family protein [soil metagenome]
MSVVAPPELSQLARRTVREVSQRLSLRAPQLESLELLAGVLDEIGFSTFVATPPKRNVAGALETIRAQHPQVEDFERDFVSLCFALATGVGKTRLMGAFIAYLHAVYSVNNFFVLAPNLTIYNKLMDDFAPGKPKYVFTGLSDFAQFPPLLITGDNYAQTDWSGAGLFGRIRINVFNISKINSEVRGGKEPKIKRFQEVLGDGYFQYLATLPDLVLLMDESHRYRASAGVRAINELNPALGLELTATPFVETSKGSTAFKNILIDYPLGRAMADGFVKEPAVVTRRDFNPNILKPDEIERIKLEDGLHLHERVKVELQTYARETNEKRVKPFVLVIARDTTHASALNELIASDAFFDGRYKNKVIQVDSSQSDELVVERLLRVERADEPTEIVIHVNMLKEGWDVTNLYTILPLRAASARILIEQSIGRGLRLPYGRRTGVTAVDRLNIVAHDKFQEIIDEANRPGSLIRLKTIVLDESEIKERSRTVVAEPSINALLGVSSAPVTTLEPFELGSSKLETPAVTPVFQTEGERRIAREAFNAMKRVGAQSGRDSVTTRALLEANVQQRIVEEVKRRVTPVQSGLAFPTDEPAPNIEAIVAKTAELMVAKTISIPRILTYPKGEVKIGFEPFVLEFDELSYIPPSQELLIQHLRTNQQERLGFVRAGIGEKRLEDYLVFALMDLPEVDYFTQSDLLYDFSSQVVRHFQESLGKDEADIRDIFIVNQKPLARFMYEQMRQHRFQQATEYETVISQGFVDLKPSAYTARAADTVYRVETPPPTKSEIKKLVYGYFEHCLYPVTKFESDPERRLAGILEREAEKWFRPARGQFHIHYRFKNDPKEYQPDFVAELKDSVVMIEVRDADELDDAEVLEKARAARHWCEHASHHAKAHGGKLWAYFVVPDSSIKANMSLAVLLR